MGDQGRGLSELSLAERGQTRDGVRGGPSTMPRRAGDLETNQNAGHVLTLPPLRLWLPSDAAEIRSVVESVRMANPGVVWSGVLQYFTSTGID